MGKHKLSNQLEVTQIFANLGTGEILMAGNKVRNIALNVNIETYAAIA